MNIEEWIKEDQKLYADWQTWGKFNIDTPLASYHEKAVQMRDALAEHRRRFLHFKLDLDTTVKFVSRSKKGIAQIVIVQHIRHRGRMVKKSFTKHVPYQVSPKVHKLIPVAA